MTQPGRHILPAVLIAAMATTLINACGDPCLDLSKKICMCEASERQQRACIQRIKREADFQPATETQNNQCTNLLTTTCQGADLCDRLAAGDLAACGLSAAQ